MAILFRVWAIPMLLATVGFAGLVCALVGDGWWDVASWAALGVLVALVVWRARQRG